METASSTSPQIREFQPDDIQVMSVQDRQLGDYHILRCMTAEDWERAMRLGVARTAYDGSLILGSAGIIKLWTGRGIAWALLSKHVHRREMLYITRWILCFLVWCEQDMDLRRIETPVRCDFPQAHRWAEMLGFVNEGKMLRYNPDGTSSFLYARTR
jgi:GNAT superfamily N-acetyltransferase